MRITECCVWLTWDSLSHERGLCRVCFSRTGSICAFCQIACGVDFYVIMAVGGDLGVDVLRRTRGSCPDLGQATRGRRDRGGFGDGGGCGDGDGFGDGVGFGGGGGFVDGGGFGTVAAAAVAQAAAIPEVDPLLEEQR
ncbi:unnamed protein product [Toxocara canis]|uniref:Uncharacterized protein n=1 Tax=Toxocara canis TaxID=6265 RepID=A0A183U0M0_TOXCA|nr:unnamed protein product [Toxocara canis]